MKLPFPGAVKVNEEKNLALDKFDEVFKKGIDMAGEGYFLLSGKEDAYLFVINGHPYGTGLVNEDGPSFLNVRDFFNIYKKMGAGDLAFFKADRKLLQSILVYFYKEPSQKFESHMVDMEKVLNTLEADGDNCIIKTQGNDKVSFSICINGKVSYNYFPDGDHADEQPRDALTLYVLDFKESPLSIEIFSDISLAAAADAISPKKDLPPSILAYYMKAQEAPAAAMGEVVIMLDNKIINKLNITKPEITIGRVQGNDIILDNPAVSRQHAVIRESEGKFVIEDKGSANGTFINGEKIAARELKDDDKIKIMNYTLTFKRHGKEEEIEELEEVGEEADKTVVISAPAAKAAQKEMKLVLDDGKEIILKSAVLTIGSNDNMDVRLEGRLIGGHHASILTGKGGAATLTHKGSFFTSTKVNGESVEQHALKNGDVIEIGKYKINFKVS